MVFVTNNITLSRLAPEDAGALAECLSDKAISEATLRIPYPYNITHAQTWLEDNFIFEEENHVNRNFAIRNQDGRLIGVIGIHINHGFPAVKSEFGYWLNKAYWNQGIMTEVIKKFCHLVKERYSITTLEAHVFAFNVSSQKVLLKAGFTQKEYLPRWHKKGDEKIDAIKFVKEL